MINHVALAPLIGRVADSVHSSFPLHHPKEDTESALWVWVFEKKNTVEDLIRNNESWEGALYHMMTKVANSHLRKEDEAAYGYSQEDAFFYTTDAIKSILEVVFNYEDWQSFSSKWDGQPRAKKQANTGGDYVAMLADVKSAVEKLRTDQRHIISLVYEQHFTASEVAELLNIGEEAAKKRTQRAVKAIQRLLGQKPLADFRQGYEGRTGALSTTESLARIERDYNG